MKISVITWDGGFRERFHTVDCFTNQDLPVDSYEFIWSEYGSSVPPQLQSKVASKANARIVHVNGQGNYHVGRCMNAGIAASTGELLVLIDGDVVADSGFLARMWELHTRSMDLVTFVRRWDQREKDNRPDSSIEHLREVCQLGNPTNYGGCQVLRRATLARANGFETHPLFDGPAPVSRDLYIRLMNLGLPIAWLASEKVCHPWHPGTLAMHDTLQQRQQAWVIKCRSQSLDTLANPQQVDQYLDGFVEDHFEVLVRKVRRLVWRSRRHLR